MIDKFLQVFTDFKVSWGSAGIMTVTLPLWEQILPLIIQICMIVSLQVISIGTDFIRTKYKLKPREKEDINLPNNKDNL